MAAPRIVVKEGEEDVIAELCTTIETKAKEILSSGGRFNVGLSGGSLVKFLCQGLPNITTEWDRWQFLFCDERMVPEDSPDSTWGLYKKGLLAALPLKESQFLAVRTDLTPQEAAEEYQDRLIRCFGSPSNLHVLLLGAGPDGHTCSLFPGHPLLEEAAPPVGRIVASITDSPKPPPARVTLTLPVVNSARCCIFAATGAGKADTMEKLLGPKEPETPLPARLVRPVDGEVIWILDSAAASKLTL